MPVYQYRTVILDLEVSEPKSRFEDSLSNCRIFVSSA